MSIDTDDGLTTRLERRLRRERSARAETERIAEEATTRLYALVNELAVFHDVLEQIPNPVAMADATGSVTFLNNAGRAALLVPDDVAVEDIRLSDFYPKLSMRSLVEIAMPQAQEHGSWRGELTMRRADGVEIPVAQDIVRHRGDDAEHYIVLIRDLSEDKAREADLRRAAYVDPVCGLPNRAAAAEEIRRHLGTSPHGGQRRSVAVVTIALEGVADVNTNYGHDAGDRLLVGVADRLQASLLGGEMLARVGPVEFCCVLGDQDRVDPLIDAVLESLARPFWVSGRQVVIGANAGSAAPVAVPVTAEMVLRQADIAVALAKAAGRGTRRVYDPSLLMVRLSQMEIEQELHHALDRGEIRTLFQPIVDTVTGELRGHEALLRWEHPRLGSIGPDTFIPLAEENGRIVDLGRWVAESGVAQLTEWNRRRTAPIFMSLNLSARQFAWPGLLPFLERLPGPDLDPGLLQLEITETATMSDPSAAVQRVAAIRSLGYRVAIDDFGTGYSSMTYLKDLHADTLKIDRSFVADLAGSDRDRAVMRAMVELARSLGMKVVAEGVEDLEQLAALVDLGVEFAQGFLFGAPGVAAEFELTGAIPPPE